eukprot:INCI10223.1.p1 GENE.INCI10223.1~~INCI10223.1.p1  ORF type:complete len:1773 (-),score=361.95 INCI10223.1:537-5855(-)
MSLADAQRQQQQQQPQQQQFLDAEANALLDGFSDDTDEDEVVDPRELEPDPRQILHENGVVGPATGLDLVSNAKFKEFYAGVANDLAVKNQLVAEAKFKSNAANHALQKQQNLVVQLRAAAAGAAAVSFSSSASPSAAKRKAAEALQAAEGELHTKAEIAAREAKVLNHAEREASRAEVRLGKLRERAEAEDVAETQNKKMLQLKADTIRHKRQQVLDATTAKRQSRLAAARAHAHEVDEKRASQLSTTMKAMKAARARAARLSNEVRAGAETLEQLQHEQLESRAQAVVSLKKNLDREYHKIAGRNAKVARREAALQQREKAEHEQILREGRNPYEVFRRRRLLEEQQRKEQELDIRIRDKKMAIADRMLRDDAFLRKREKTLAAEREYEQSYKTSLKRSHQDKKVEAYMKSVTKSGVSMVDPTGRTFRLEPSKLTTIKTNKFGLGGADRDVIKNLQHSRRALRDVEPARILLKNNRPTSADSSLPTADDSDDEAPTRVEQDDRDSGSGMDEDEDLTASDKRLDPAASTIYGSAMASLFKKAPLPRFEDSAGASNNQRPHTSPGPGAQSSPAPATAGTSGGVQGDANSVRNNKLVTRELSVLEKRMVTGALAKQRENLVSKQVVWGKEFTGRAFLSKPDVIEFKDFVVGQKMRRSIVLTNVSYSFNTFKLLDLPDDVRDFFHIKYSRPGRMSAGMTCTLQITFHPKTQLDIHSELPLLAQTGPFSIPIICLAKKAKPVLDSHSVFLEDVITAESETRVLTLENRGALDTDFEIVPRGNRAEDAFRGRGDEVEDQDAIPPEHLAMLSFPTSGTVRSRKQRSLTFTFSPTEAPVAFTLRLLVRFSDPNCPDQELRVRVSSAQVPIFVREPVVDFRCCVVGKLYRCDLVVCNRGKSALKAQFPASPYLRDCLEFNPDVGFIQGASVDPATGAKTPGCMSVQLRFRPTFELLERCAKYILGNEDCVIENATAPWLEIADLRKVLHVPIKIAVPDQALPVSFSLLAQLDDSNVTFDPPLVDFGTVYATQATEVTVTLTSHAAVPQRFGFVNLPTEVHVLPLDGPSTLLPGENASLRIRLQPTTATQKDFVLLCRTSLNQTFKLSVKANAVDPPLQVSQTLVRFRPVAPGDWIEQSIFLRNVGAGGDPSQTTQASQQNSFAKPSIAPREKEFEIVIPDEVRHELKISPLVGTVGPGGSTRVEVEFTPKNGAVELETQNGSDGDSESGAGAATDELAHDGRLDEGEPEIDDAAIAESVDEPSSDHLVAVSDFSPKLGGVVESRHRDGAEPWSQHGEWLIPIFIRDKVSTTADLEAGRDGAGGSKPYPPMFVKVQTTTVQRVLVASPEAVNFKQVAVGNVETVTVRLTNVSAVDANLVLQPLNPTGPFRVVNAIRPLAAGASLDVLVQFAPAQQLRYCESLVVTSQLGRFAVVLAGQGVAPVLRLTPEDGIVDLGHVVAGQIVTKTITLENTSIFPLPCSLVPTSRQPHTFSGRPVFDCSPCELVVEPNRERKVTITFAPDHEQAGPFHFAFQVVTPNENDAERLLQLCGHCWERQLYVVPDDPMALADPSTSSDAALKFRLPQTLGLFPVESEAAEPSEDSADTSAGIGGVSDPFALLHALDESALQPSIQLTALEVATLGPDAPLPRRLVLVFPKLDGEGKASRAVTFGSCPVDPAARGSAGNFALRFRTNAANSEDSGGFEASSMGGALANGTQTTVTFSFQQSVNEEDLPKGPVRIAQWIERTVEASLSGGFVPSGVLEAAPRVVEIVLRAFALQ